MNVIILIIIVHWIADFIFQDEKWATNKSISFISLIRHTSVYAAVWVFPVLLATSNLPLTLVFVGVVFLTHTLVDYFTSKIVSKKFKNNQLGSPIPNFGAFTIIGFDQVLHYLQLFITWQLLFGEIL